MNADEIARGLSPFQPETVSVQAGRRLRELLAAGESFALETTLATRIYLPIIEQARAAGYTVNLVFFWLNSPDLAVARVQARVREGGHSIPEPVIRRRYIGGLRQFFAAYQMAVDSWVLLDNSAGAGQPIAEGNALNVLLHDASKWHYLLSTYHV